jgi:hypothetical protein
MTKRTPRVCGAAVLALSFAAALVVPARTEIIVRLEITAAKASVHLEPDSDSPVVEVLDRGAIIKLASAQRFRTNWLYVLFVSSRTGRTLAGYVLDEVVRKLTSTLKIVDLTPASAEIASPKDFDLNRASLPAVSWGSSENGILRAEGRPLDRERSGDMEFLRYHREVFGKRCLVTYVLVDRRLASIRLRLLEKYADKDRYVADYNRIREFLNAKVGQPRFNNVVWKDIAYAERGVNLGTAVRTGNLSLSSEWVYQDTGLRLSLTGENSEVLFAAEINDLKAKNPASF